MSKFNKEHMQLAARWASQSDARYQVGCVLYKNEGIAGAGFNKDNLHAEVETALSCVAGLSSYYPHYPRIAYVYRGRKDGRPANSKPCPNCQAALKRIGVKEVFYSCSDGPHFRKLVL